MLALALLWSSLCAAGPVPSVPSAPLPLDAVAGAPAPVFSAPLGLVIAGAPGSGKGTHGALLAAEFGLVHVSAGDLLRAHALENPELAEVMRRGELVPAPLVVSLVRERLARPDVRARGFVLDGFPRRLEEVGFLQAMRSEGLPVDAVIRLEVVESELERRVLARGRPDDTPETFRNRMRVFRETTLPALEALEASAPVAAPDVSSPDRDLNYRKVREALLAASPRARALSSR